MKALTKALPESSVRKLRRFAKWLRIKRWWLLRKNELIFQISMLRSVSERLLETAETTNVQMRFEKNS
jgi:hypothetical protein